MKGTGVAAAWHRAYHQCLWIMRPDRCSSGGGRQTVKTVNRKTVSDDWAVRGFSCALWIDPPGQRWEDFVHDSDELVVVVEGDMEFEIGGEIKRPGIGEELYIPAGVIHSVRNIGVTTARWLYGYRQ